MKIALINIDVSLDNKENGKTCLKGNTHRTVVNCARTRNYCAEYVRSNASYYYTFAVNEQCG